MISAAAGHEAAMAAIHETAFPEAPWDSESFVVLLAQPGVFGFIDPGGIVLARAVADEAEILTIGVTKRRAGIGRALMLAAIQVARDQGATIIHLEVAASNVAALGLYTALSFAQVGARPKYYPDGGDALLLTLRY